MRVFIGYTFNRFILNLFSITISMSGRFINFLATLYIYIYVYTRLHIPLLSCYGQIHELFLFLFYFCFVLWGLFCSFVFPLSFLNGVVFYSFIYLFFYLFCPFVKQLFLGEKKFLNFFWTFNLFLPTNSCLTITFLFLKKRREWNSYNRWARKCEVSIPIYIYIYIYVCVCVCVCILTHARTLIDTFSRVLSLKHRSLMILSERF